MKLLIRTYACFCLLVFTMPLMASDKTHELHDLMSSNIDDKEPGFSVLFAHNGEVLLHRAYGLADVEHMLPLKTNMHFRIASITKQFTTSAAMLLEQDGLISFDDDIRDHLPGYTTHGESISLEQLATNTSGIPQYQDFQGFSDFEKVDHSLDELIAYFSHRPLVFEPGEKYDYSSSNYALLAKLIEVKSGLPYETFLQKRIFKPLDMNSTFLGDEKAIQPARVRGYEKRNGELFNAPHISMTNPHGAGALRSTTMDLYRWQRALVKGKVLTDEQRERAWSATELNDGSISKYGYGWSVGNVHGMKVLSHPGGIPGFVSFAGFIPEEDLHFILLSNLPSIRLTDIAIQAINIVLDKPATPEEKSLPAEMKAALQGNYALESGFEFSIVEDNDHFYLLVPATGNKLALSYAGPSAAYYGDGWSRIVLPDDSGDPAQTIKIVKWTGLEDVANRVNQ